jgi:HEAT repeat protein
MGDRPSSTCSASSSSSSNLLLATAIAIGVLIAAATALAAPIAADKENETPITATGPEAQYLGKVHARVHSRWAENFLRLASAKLPASDAINDPARAVTVELVFGADGQVVSLETVQSAGVPGFDDAAKEVLRDSVPFPWADADLRSDDGLVHLRWTFARDQRRCSGMTLLHFEEPLAIALPKLIRDGREEEALRRMRVARAAGTPIDPMMTTLAAAWIKAAVGHPNATVAAAEMLATLGDSAGPTWLKAAVKRPETALAAGRALAARHVPICPLVTSMLSSASAAASASASSSGPKPAAATAKPPTPAEQLTAANALATAGEAECAPGLIALLEDHKAHTDARVAAAVALGAIANDEATKKALAGAGKDDVVAVRAAATLAGARPGSGRSKVFALVPPLRDPSPEMRAAAAAGIVRAGGDSNLADLYVIFTDKDPRPSAAVATELDHLRTAEATKLLVRLLKRSALPVQLAAARALVGRGARDSYSALRPFLDAKVDPELHGLALVSADASTLDNLAQVVAASNAGDPKVAHLALATYRARLARAERTAAGDLWLSAASKLSPTERTDAMAEWLTGGKTLNASAAATTTTASVTPKR